jgi:putative protease
VISTYRKLIDEHRGATEDEIRKMASLFCRSGFTDGYHVEKINKNMLGVRTDSDKQVTASADKTVMDKRRIALSLDGAFLENEPAVLVGTVERDGEIISHRVTGDVCVKAEKTPTSADRIAENLGKLGATPFRAEKVDVRADDVNVPISSINAMRRELAAAMEEKLIGDVKAYPKFEKLTLPHGSVASDEKSAYFAFYDTVTKKAKGFFNRIFVPLTEYIAHIDDALKYENIGIALPPVAFDHEIPSVREMAKKAALAGCKLALVSGFWQSALADELGFSKHGDIRLNAYNSTSVSVYAEKGFSSLVLSPEIGVSASMGVAAEIPKGYVIYGRLPLMTMEKCAIRDMMLPNVMSSASCHYCDTHDFSYLTDRTGTKFPMTREYQHRNVIYNSVPTYMADKPLAGLFSHAIFTTETVAEVDAVIDAIEKRSPAKTKFRRL